MDTAEAKGIKVNWFWKTSSEWNLGDITPPWRNGMSIHGHITKHITPTTKGLTEGGQRLPDEKDDRQIKWVAGGMDGAFGHHGSPGGNKDRARMLHRALDVVLKDATSTKFEKLYQQLLQDGAIEFIDPLLQRIVEGQDLQIERLEALALWLAKNSPDREPVKFAIALLGIITGADHTELLVTLGRHEEFTLYSATAISNLDGENVESRLFDLAQHVNGWGRIHVVERLAKADDPKIRSWLLRDGYKNSIMYEYTAYTCAYAGNLRGELEGEHVEEDLLVGAANIIAALITGGPAEGIDDYADGSVVVESYLRHLGPRPTDLEHLITIGIILDFLNRNGDWTERSSRGWTPTLRNSLRSRVLELKALPQWREKISEDLNSTDPIIFNQAHRAASTLGLDTWDHHFRRLETGEGDGWYFVMQTGDPGRIDQVLKLAERTIPLDDIASGPAEELGLGPSWRHHGHLDFVLQDLRRFPGKGWSLIRAGIRSPVVRNRHMALRALSPWTQNEWPPEARPLLQSALAAEPDDEVSAELRTLLTGGRLEDPKLDIS